MAGVTKGEGEGEGVVEDTCLVEKVSTKMMMMGIDAMRMMIAGNDRNLTHDTSISCIDSTLEVYNRSASRLVRLVC